MHIKAQRTAFNSGQKSTSNFSRVFYQFHNVTNFICICLWKWSHIYEIFGALILSTSCLCGKFLLMFERRFINIQHKMSKHFQYKIRYIVIYYSGNILINKNNTRHRKRGHKKWRHQCKTNALRKKLSVKKYLFDCFSCIYVIWKNINQS